jgi:hypothetical protein
LDRLCVSLFKRTWYIQFPGKEPVPLRDWLKEHDPDGKEP